MKLSVVFAAVGALAAIPVIAALSGAESGLDVGAGTPPYHPTHVAGEFKGTKTCFV